MSTLQGDAPCNECGTTDNIVWFTDNTLWNNAVRGPDYALAMARWGVDPILCLTCFIGVVEEQGYRPAGWRVLPEWPVRQEATS